MGASGCAFARTRVDDRSCVLEGVRQPDADAQGKQERLQAAPRYRHHLCSIISSGAPPLTDNNDKVVS